MSHYFTTPQGEARERTITVDLDGEPLDVTTAAGVFSAEGLDKATAILLREERPRPTARRVLDLGCGWGPIALALARALPEATVDAVDVNERALALTAANARALGLRVATFAPEQADPAVRYDEIWSNPPIRIGKAALHELLLTWLARLTDAGVARLVVGKNLGADSLQAWLQTQGYACERVASAKGFRILRVSRPIPLSAE